MNAQDVFEALGTVHFARWLLLDEERAGTDYPNSLVFESNFDCPDGSTQDVHRTHLQQLVQHAGPAFRSLYGACEGYPSSPGALVDYLFDHRVSHTARYQGHIDRDLQRIFEERRVARRAVHAWQHAPARLRGRQLWEYIRNDVQRAVGLDLNRAAPAGPTLCDRDRKREQGPPRAPLRFLAAGMSVWARLSRLGRGDRDYFDIYARDASRSEGAATFADRLATLDSENRTGLQNELSHLVPVRTRQLRQLKLSHGLLRKLASEHYDHVEDLGGSPAIHFAKWLLIDDERRLLFLSNYDFGWESYLDDFVTLSAPGLNLAWDATHQFPPTWAIQWGGATHEQHFKLWARAYQRPAQVFYSAYPQMSVTEINNNTWIRNGLHAPPDDLAGWLGRLT